MDEETITMEKGNVKLVLQYDVGDGEMLECAKDRETPPERYRVVVFIDGKKVATYVRTFESQPATGHLNNFLKKFAIDPSYRKEYFSTGTMHWEGVVEWDDPVNPKTRAAISRMNHASMAKLRFKDFARLQTGGMDGYSRKSEIDIDVAIGEGDAATLNAEFGSNAITRLAAKRWVARGLNVDKAIHKAKTDMEISENAERARRGDRDGF